MMDESAGEIPNRHSILAESSIFRSFPAMGSPQMRPEHKQYDTTEVVHQHAHEVVVNTMVAAAASTHVSTQRAQADLQQCSSMGSLRVWAESSGVGGFQGCTAVDLSRLSRADGAGSIVPAQRPPTRHPAAAAEFPAFPVQVIALPRSAN